MKNIFLTSIFLLILASCKKEKTEVTQETVTDSTQIIEKPNNIETYSAVEYSPEKMTDFLSNKENDTVYVTNFFATWCPPCIKEIPHFKEKMEEYKNQPVKFTFISLDEKNDWNEAVKNFAEEKGLSKNVVLLDGSKLSPDFFTTNFKTWDGGSIPFTFIKKGNQTDETVGMMSKEDLSQKLSKFVTTKSTEKVEKQVEKSPEPAEYDIKKTIKEQTETN